MRRRLANGIALLCDLSLSIKEVAALVGFTNPGNFTRAFQQATGSTPTAFRAYLQSWLHNAESRRSPLPESPEGLGPGQALVI